MGVLHWLHVIDYIWKWVVLERNKKTQPKCFSEWKKTSKCLHTKTNSPKTVICGKCTGCRSEENIDVSSLVIYFKTLQIWRGPLYLYSEWGAKVLHFYLIVLLFLSRFNYRSTHHLASHGFYEFLNWFDERAWYPLGRIVGGTVSIVIINLLKYI